MKFLDWYFADFFVLYFIDYTDLKTEIKMQKRLLIIEDDVDLREGLRFCFNSDGFEVTDRGGKKEGLETIRKESFDLVLLDCNLPDGTGFDLCREVRLFSKVPIIMLTARDTEMDEIKALELGANDYLSKPFSLGVLKARVKRLLNSSSETEVLLSGDISVDKSCCKVFKDGKEVSLSPQEYRLALYLIENKGHVLSKEQILERIWDSSGKFVDNNTVSVNISRLRTKLDEDGEGHIKTLHGLGYVWKE